MFSGKEHMSLYLSLHMRFFTTVRIKEINSSTTKKWDETKTTYRFEVWKAISQFCKKNAISKFRIRGAHRNIHSEGVGGERVGKVKMRCYPTLGVGALASVLDVQS